MRYGALVTLGLLGVTLGALPIQVSLNEKPVFATAVVRNGRVLLPFRPIFNALEATVSYDGRTRTVHARRSGKRISLKVGERASVVIAQRLYVPVRYVSEAFGGRVQYDAVDRVVFITDPHANAPAVRVPRLAAEAPDLPATPQPAYTPPIPYATDNGYAPYGPAMNFYIPTNQYTYYPGERVEFVLDAPPGGNAYVDLCGIGRLQLVNPLGSAQYFLSFIVPRQLSGRACWVTAYYYGVLGAQRSIVLPSALAFAAFAPQPTASPTPKPKPTAGALRVTQPVGRSPQSTAARATPAPTARPARSPKPKVTPPEKPQGKRTR